MARYSCMLVLVVIVCAFEKVASIRPAAGGDGGGSPLQYKGAGAARSASGRKGGGGTPTWKQDDEQGGVSATWYEKATWKQETGGCTPCEEVYVVRDEGETLQTISEKCHAPFILLDNPHVQDTDDISAGSVLLISSTHLPC